MMSYPHSWLLAAMVLASCISMAGAEEVRPPSLVEEVRKGCEKELTSYCSQVTPGEGRQLACIYAYGYKLSSRCEYALYDASIQLERAISAMSFLATECEKDLEAYCASVAPGQGRILDCLNKHSKQLTGRCSAALTDVGAK